MKKIVLKSALLMSVMFLISCDQDFNTIGSDVIGDDHFGLEKKDDVSVIAYTKSTGEVQSNNLPSNMMGYYRDPFFGTTKASFVTQLTLASVDPDFGFEADITATDSVYLYVPYLSTQTATGTGNEPNTYELNSTYGEDFETATFDLKIYKSDYFLRDFGTNPEERQKYYSGATDRGLIESHLDGAPLNEFTGAVASETTAFKFSNEEIIIYKRNANGDFLDSSGNVTTDESAKVVSQRLAPGMWVNLDPARFRDIILNASSSDLLNNNIFKEYFKGLYFQMNENDPDKDALTYLDFSKGYIMMQYHSKDTDEATAEVTKKSVRINMTGNTINFFQNNFSSAYGTALSNSNSTTGDELLYLKGNEGSVVFIDLFGPDTDANNVPNQLEELRAENILVNDAFLTFYVKNDGQKNATRIYLYDATNNTPLLDYIYDSSTATDPKNNKLLFGGILEVEEDNEDLGVKFRIRIRSHIDNIINGENPNTNKNVRLGLSVTDNIANSSSYTVFDSVNFGNEELPVGSIISPVGTIVYGNNTSDESKKLKLEIYYTKPN